MQNINHILVVDDDDRIRNLLGQFLKDKGFFVSLSPDASDAWSKLNEYVFDLIIVDVMMPGETGVEFTANFRKKNDAPVLMLTAMGEVEDRIAGLESGADDYLPKPFDPRELLLRVNSILQRTKKSHDNSMVFNEVMFDLDKNRLHDSKGDIIITSNESKLLKVLSINKGKAVSREELAKLCGGINERSVDVQITRLRNKIEKEPKKPRYLKTVRGEGYVLYSDL
jgi:two-component system phosphate regulon response regulator OmpR